MVILEVILTHQLRALFESERKNHVEAGSIAARIFAEAVDVFGFECLKHTFCLFQQFDVRGNGNHAVEHIDFFMSYQLLYCKYTTGCDAPQAQKQGFLGSTTTAFHP